MVSLLLTEQMLHQDLSVSLWQHVSQDRQDGTAEHMCECRLMLGVQGLLWAVAGQVHPENLFQSNWEAVPQTLPVLSLAFVYQNVVPVICSRLEVKPPCREPSATC